MKLAGAGECKKQSQLGNLLLHKTARYVNLAGELFAVAVGF